MEEELSWTDRRKEILEVVTGIVTKVCPVSGKAFGKQYLAGSRSKPIGIFNANYVADARTHKILLREFSKATGIGIKEVEKYYKNEDRFDQFAERLLRAMSEKTGEEEREEAE